MRPLALSFITLLRKADAGGANTFGQFITMARVGKGLSQKRLARLVTLDEMTIVNWEKSDFLPRQYWRIKELCEKLEVSYTDIVERFAWVGSDEGFGSRLRKARIVKGLKQKEAARLARVDPTTLRRWEHATVAPPKSMAEKLVRLRQVLGIERSGIEM